MDGRKTGFDSYGKHLIAGEWVRSEPAHGDARVFDATSVGTMAIRRFQRPVSDQNLPDALMPAGWQ